MDNIKIGELIRKLRIENNYTQLQLAEKLNVTDKTISKWERGLGCPDVALLVDLSTIFNVNIEKILQGELNKSKMLGGNFNRIKFYHCDCCDNVISSTNNIEVSCCGRVLKPIPLNKEVDTQHQLTIEESKDELYCTLSHPMEKDHFISFVAVVKFDQVLIHKLYPEQNSEFYIPNIPKSKIFVYCTKHGLYRIR